MRNQPKTFHFLPAGKRSASKNGEQLFGFLPQEQMLIAHQALIIPNMATFIRDVTEYGNIGAVKKRVLSLHLGQLIKLVWLNKLNLIHLAKKEFAYGIILLMQIELLKSEKAKPSMIILADQVCDLAIALNNGIIIKQFITLTKNQYHIPAAIMTNNLPAALAFLSEIKANPDYIFTPFNSYGYEMNPSQKAVESALLQIPVDKLIACTPDNSAHERAYLQKFQIVQTAIGWL